MAVLIPVDILSAITFVVIAEIVNKTPLTPPRPSIIFPIASINPAKKSVTSIKNSSFSNLS
jgi:hypothetical protein